MVKTQLIVDRDYVVSELDRRVFGSFVEHMGRCVYTGIYEPGHPTADENGFRRDVLELTRELGVTIVRYPGGNFLSGYNWEDGVGPKEKRPRRLDLAWLSTETNAFGTNEFMDWCRLTGVEPMWAVNLGTRGPDEARHFLEYCNHPGGTQLSDLRRSHGHVQPHDIRFWCLGNEMDGPWQMGQKTPQEYGRIAKETAKVMRLVDPRVQLAACGSSKYNMATFGRWEYEVLEHCYDEVDFITLHTYFENPHNDTSEFLGNIDRTDRFIKEVAAIADAVAARRDSTKRLMLSVDEWNVWYKNRTMDDRRKPGWPEAPPLIEEVYNFEDALAVAGALMVFMNNADRVKAACQAQLVNVIGMIMTEPGGPAWRQTIFHPFALSARHARGVVLQPVVRTPVTQGKWIPEMPQLVASVTYDQATGRTALFLLNRNLAEEQELSIDLRGMRGSQTLVEAIELHHADMKATNTKDAPDRIQPGALQRVRVDGGKVQAVLKPGSWNVIVLEHPKEA